MNNKYNQGAIWRKWDLHAHTPLDHEWINKPELSNDEDKRAFAKEYIAFAKAQNLSVIAITDHNFCNNLDDCLIPYLQEAGESEEITILPGFEITAKDGSGIHLLCIFPEKTELQKIKNVVIGCFNPNEDLFQSTHVPVSKKTIDEINTLIIESGLETIMIFAHADRENGVLNPKTISGVRRIEEWKNKHIQIAQIAKAPNEYEDSFMKSVVTQTSDLYSREMTYVVASDCRKINKEEGPKERLYLGQKSVWIKADPTFEGLKQIINEPERVCYDEEPPLLAKVQQNRTKYIDHLSISQISGYNGIHGRWFDNIVVPFNKELVAIIGNKGSGKSAIADIVALCSNVNPTTDFSFLTNKKFREKSGRIAKNFKANLVFESTDGFSKGLNDSGEEDDQPLVKYLPQGQFETLTNEIVGAEEFRKEIEKVVFTHLKEEDRYGASNFQEVIENEKRVVEEEISHQKIRLKEINRQIIDLEQKTKPSYKTQLENSIEQKRKEVKALIKPEEVADPNNNPEIKTKNKQDLSRIKELTKEIEDLETKIRKKKEKRNSLKTEVRTLNDTKKTIELKVKEINEYKNNLRTSFNKDFAIDIDKVLSVEVDFKTINDLIASKSTEIEGLGNELGDSEDADKTQSLPLSLSAKQGELKTLQNGLGYEQRLYQEYLNALANFEKSKSEIEGNETTPDTIKYLEKELNYVANDLTSDLKNKKDARNEISKLIFDAKKKVITIYRTTKSTIDSEIKKNAELLGDYRININATLVLQARFNDEFFPKIDRQKAGTFRGKEDGAVQLKKITDEVNFDEKDQVIEFLRKIIDALNNDLRDPNNPKSSVILDQVKDPEKLYEYLFGLEFLDYNYQLRQGDKSLEQLSPGERGALLLVFYLLLDKDDKPLIIDQPEDNLDNHSVAKVLVPFIRRAKKNRQIIMVTHNPNLAVYADAEQIICVDIDKENKNKFSFKSGSIENNEINESIVKILEGTMPAFNKRKQKYHSN